MSLTLSARPLLKFKTQDMLTGVPLAMTVRKLQISERRVTTAATTVSGTHMHENVICLAMSHVYAGKSGTMTNEHIGKMPQLLDIVVCYKQHKV